MGKLRNPVFLEDQSTGFTLLVHRAKFVIGVWVELVAISVISTGYLRRKPWWTERYKRG